MPCHVAPGLQVVAHRVDDADGPLNRTTVVVEAPMLLLDERELLWMDKMLQVKMLGGALLP